MGTNTLEVKYTLLAWFFYLRKEYSPLRLDFYYCFLFTMRRGTATLLMKDGTTGETRNAVRHNPPKNGALSGVYELPGVEHILDQQVLRPHCQSRQMSPR